MVARPPIDTVAVISDSVDASVNRIAALSINSAGGTSASTRVRINPMAAGGYGGVPVVSNEKLAVPDPSPSSRPDHGDPDPSYIQTPSEVNWMNARFLTGILNLLV
jgi:hypothetical protein